MDWLASIDEEQLHLSIVSLAELRHGIERLDAGRRKTALDLWLTEQLPLRFDNRLLPVDAETADAWGRIVEAAQAAGRPIGAIDAFIAATAKRHQFKIGRSEEHTSELQSLMSISFTDFCLKHKNKKTALTQYSR